MLAIDLLLELLDKGEPWHDIEEIADEAPLSRTEILDIIDFLARYKFIILNEDRRRARIAEEIHEFLTEIKQEEKENSV